MKRVYIIELGGEKEVNEMDALEMTTTIDNAIEWIQDTMKSDAEYFNCRINCTIYIDYDKDDNSLTNQYCDALVYIDADRIVTEEMFASDIYDVETIIESNLSIISKIVAKGEIKEVSE